MKYIFSFFIAAFSSTCIWAMPSQIILMRHGEKIPSGAYLSLKGRQRAAALVPTFLGSPTLLHYGPPAAIYVMKSGKNAPAVRWSQTVISIADELNIPLQNQYNRREIEHLVKEVRETEEYEGKMVLICWSRGELPSLASQFGAKKAPKKWPQHVFDRFWVLTFEENGEVTFEDLPQKLLYGDSAK